ncbi:hypothetical protein VYU27_005558 [Nannochloropsis oceanica]
MKAYGSGSRSNNKKPRRILSHRKERKKGVSLKRLAEALEHDSLLCCRAVAPSEATAALENVQAGLLERGYILLYLDDTSPSPLSPISSYYSSPVAPAAAAAAAATAKQWQQEEYQKLLVSNRVAEKLGQIKQHFDRLGMPQSHATNTRSSSRSRSRSSSNSGDSRISSSAKISDPLYIHPSDAITTFHYLERIGRLVLKAASWALFPPTDATQTFLPRTPSSSSSPRSSSSSSSSSSFSSSPHSSSFFSTHNSHQINLEDELLPPLPSPPSPLSPSFFLQTSTTPAVAAGAVAAAAAATRRKAKKKRGKREEEDDGLEEEEEKGGEERGGIGGSVTGGEGFRSRLRARVYQGGKNGGREGGREGGRARTPMHDLGLLSIVGVMGHGLEVKGESKGGPEGGGKWEEEERGKRGHVEKEWKAVEPMYEEEEELEEDGFEVGGAVALLPPWTVLVCVGRMLDYYSGGVLSAPARRVLISKIESLNLNRSNVEVCYSVRGREGGRLNPYEVRERVWNIAPLYRDPTKDKEVMNVECYEREKGGKEEEEERGWLWRREEELKTGGKVKKRGREAAGEGGGGMRRGGGEEGGEGGGGGGGRGGRSEGGKKYLGKLVIDLVHDCDEEEEGGIEGAGAEAASAAVAALEDPAEGEEEKGAIMVVEKGDEEGVAAAAATTNADLQLKGEGEPVEKEGKKFKKEKDEEEVEDEVLEVGVGGCAARRRYGAPTAAAAAAAPEIVGGREREREGKKEGEWKEEENDDASRCLVNDFGGMKDGIEERGEERRVGEAMSTLQWEVEEGEE